MKKVTVAQMVEHLKLTVTLPLLTSYVLDTSKTVNLGVVGSSPTSNPNNLCYLYSLLLKNSDIF